MIAEHHKLYVPSMEVKIVFMCEMQGQISDGMWENLRPFGHWKKWSSLTWDDVIVSHELFGRTFEAPFSKYAFSDPELLKIISTRLLFKIQLYQMYPRVVEPILKENHWDIPDGVLREVYLSNQLNAYMSDSQLKLEVKGLTSKMMKTVLLQSGYQYSDLVEDCKILQDACRTRIR